MSQAEPFPTDSQGATEYCFAHLSDPHLTSLRGVRFRDLANKRLLGYLSWRHRRREEHRGEILDALLADLRQFRPRQLLLTGDLTHVGLPEEFVEAAAWLRRLGTPERVMLVPGNHDCYVAAPWEATFGRWRDYLGGARDASAFPLLRRAGGMAFIGVSTAVPTPPFFATGSIGRRQLARLQQMLEETGREGLIRVLLIHHPPLAGSVGWRKRLIDAAALRAVLSRGGVELVLHGHAHRATAGALSTPAGQVPVLGVPAASAAGLKPGRRARYHLCRVQRQATACFLEVVVRGYDPGTGMFVEVARHRLRLPWRAA